MLLKANKFLVYDIDNTKKTPLHWAAQKGYNLMAKLLIDNGSDVDSVDLIKRTPLHLCAKNNNVETTKLLLAYMANPFAKSITDKSTLDYTKNDKDG